MRPASNYFQLNLCPEKPTSTSSNHITSQLIPFSTGAPNHHVGIFASFAELVDKVAEATTTWCNAG